MLFEIEGVGVGGWTSGGSPEPADHRENFYVTTRRKYTEKGKFQQKLKEWIYVPPRDDNPSSSAPSISGVP